jgi:hypothetical protein
LPHRSGISIAIGMWWKGDKIASKLNAIQDDLTRSHQMFIVSFFLKNVTSGRSWLFDFQMAGVLRSEHRLIDLDTKVQAMINEGAKRPEKAQSLVRIDRMDHRQMKTALHRASNVCSWQPAAYSYS